MVDRVNVMGNGGAVSGVVGDGVSGAVSGGVTGDGVGRGGDGGMVLSTHHLYKVYGKRTVVNDVSIEVHQGEIVGLLGPNGAGKTTTFYMTTGLVVPNSGRIFLNDREITRFPCTRGRRRGSGIWLRRRRCSGS